MLLILISVADSTVVSVCSQSAEISTRRHGAYGFGVISGDEIGIQRMVARPLATMTIEKQEEYERAADKNTTHMGVFSTIPLLYF